MNRQIANRSPADSANRSVSGPRKIMKPNSNPLSMNQMWLG
jgi:hypothetical protein